MQTFLPYPDFTASAAVLDPARLGKQRVETLQSLRALVIPDYGWRRHPAIRMWMGHVPALVQYGLAMVDEWVGRGHSDSTRTRILEFAPEVASAGLRNAGPQQASNGDSCHGGDSAGQVLMPPWMGDPAFHLAHQSNLVQKAPDFYRDRFPRVPEDLPYIWPEPAEVLLPQDPAGRKLWIWRAKTSIDAVGTSRPDNPAEYLQRPEHERPNPHQLQDQHLSQNLHLHVPAQGPSGRASPKWQRQLATFIDDVQDGDDVAVADPDGARYRTGVVGELTLDDDGGATRAVTPTGWLNRTDFEYPALLQDPRTFFALPAPALLQA